MQDPEILLHQLNHYKPLIDRAFKLTESYVSEHKLILTGGMAIDIALREKGKAIYADDNVPDYDIISDENLKHANALAEILCKEGLSDVDVINAFHITTMKVRMKRVGLLDSTYIPPECYVRIPYLDVGGLRIVHPHYQFIDQRLSLSQLMADTGLSLNIFHRLPKDVARNAILRESYPIEASIVKLDMHTVRIPLDLIRIDTTLHDQLDPDAFVYTGPTCIAGYLGYVIMMAQLNKFKFTITATHLEVSMPKDIPVRLLTYQIDSLKSYIHNPIITRPLINLKPITQRDGDFEYVDTYGLRIGCHMINLSDSLTVCVASVDYLLMEMLRDRIYVSDMPYSGWYVEFVATVDKMQATKDSSMIWWPSINCYGRIDLPEHRIFAMEKLLNSEESKNSQPKKSYLKQPKCSTKSGFDPNSSHYYRIDGAEDKSIAHTNYGYVVQEFKEFIDKKRNES